MTAGGGPGRGVYSPGRVPGPAGILDDLESRHGWIFGTGLLVYFLGFVLLAFRETTLAPFLIVAGTLVMLGAFLAP